MGRTRDREQPRADGTTLVSRYRKVMSQMVYHSGEKVFVYQGTLLYEAKITKSFDPITQKIDAYDEKRKEHTLTAPNKKFPQNMLSEVCYLVHYSGWNAKWDEWVLPSRILEINNENLMLKENLEFEVKEQDRIKREALEAEERRKEREKLQKGKEKDKYKLKSRGKEKEKLTIKLQKIIGYKEGSGKSQKDPIVLSSLNGNNGSKSNLSINGKKRQAEVQDKSQLLKHSNNKIQPNGKTKEVSSIGSSDIEPKLKRKRFNEVNDDLFHYESKTGFTHYEIKSLVPNDLKIILVDDWENITKNNKLVSLTPVKCKVSETLEDFTKYLREEFNDKELKDELKIFLEITESIKLYFDQSLGTFLLYRYERPQYSEVLGNTEIRHLYDAYPPIFLLRLLSIFPNILMLNNVDPNTIRTSKVYLDIILFWLEQNKEKYFIHEYENQSPWISLMHG